MRTGEVKIVKIFLASSNELKNDRDLFAAFISRLNEHYEPRGYHFILKIWEFLDPAYNSKPKQEEYNDEIKKCDYFVALFHTKAGKYTVQELQVARNECRIRHLPLFIYFKNLDYWQALQKKDENLEAVKKLIGEDDMKHFWGSYNNNDKLHLDFVLWLDDKLGQSSAIKVEDNEVRIGNLSVAQFSQLPFAANNAEYKRIEEQLAGLEQDIEQLQQDINEYPDNIKFSERLSQKVTARDKLLQDVLRQQNALLSAAKHIAELRRQKTSEKLAKAAEAFEDGQLDVANRLLDEIAKEAESHIDQLEQNRMLVHQDIEALRLQAQIIMADGEVPITDRVARIFDIYAKADDWANRSAYNKTKYVQLLFEYALFLYDYDKFDLAVEVWLRQIKLSEELYGTNDDHTSNSYNNIATVYVKIGENNLALKYFLKALRINEAVLGDHHLNIAVSYNNIASVYVNKGDFDEALDYMLKALSIQINELGPNHLDNALLYNNIGTVHSRKEEYTKALKYHLKALDISKKAPDLDNSQIALFFNTIGMDYYYLKEYLKAINYLNKSLTIRVKLLGINHSSTASTINNIGMVYHRSGYPDKALECYSKAQSIFEQVLGDDHVLTATSYNNMGTAYATLGVYTSALDYLTMAMTIRENKLGPSHPDTIQTRNLINSVKKMMER